MELTPIRKSIIVPTNPLVNPQGLPHVDDLLDSQIVPVMIYFPVRRAGFSALKSDISFGSHVESISAMSSQEVSQANRIRTELKAIVVRKEMEQLENLRKSSLDTFRLEKITIKDIEALSDARAQYYALLPLTFKINDLPAELLAHVFRLAVWPLTATFAGLPAAVRLTHVCRLWRSVAIRDRRLWNPVCFRDPANLERDFSILERAGPTGLDIRIWDKRAAPMSKQAMTNLITRIFRLAHGIRRLAISTYSRDAMDPVLDALYQVSESGLPVPIEFIKLRCLAGKQTNAIGRTGSLGASFSPPFLQHLALDNVPVDWSVDLLSRLTTLELRRLPLGNGLSSALFRAVLQKATNLEKLSLASVELDDMPNAPGCLTPVVLSTVRILLIGFHGLHAEYFLSHFATPNVLDLALVPPFSYSINSLLTSLTSSNRMPMVKILNLIGFPDTEGPIPSDQAVLISRWFSTMPNLTFLRLINPSVTLLDLLLFDHDQNGRDPDIEKNSRAALSRGVIFNRLSYLDCQSKPCNFPQILRCLAGRKSLGVPLQRLWVPARTAAIMTTRQIEALWRCLGEHGAIKLSGYRTDEENLVYPDVYIP